MSLPLAGPQRPFSSVLWKTAGGIALFVLTAIVMNAFLPEEQRFGGGSLGNDLMPSYAAGTMVLNGEGAQMFNPYAATRIVEGIWDTYFPGVPHPNHGLAAWLNPPFFALLFVPLAAIPYPTALWVWTTFNCVLTLISCLLLLRLLPPGLPWTTRALVPVLVVMSFPFLRAMLHQQNTPLSLAILCGAVCLAMRANGAGGERLGQRSHLAYAAGLVGGLLFFKPQLAMVTLIALAIVAGYRVLIGAVITGTLLLAAQEWAVPGSTWQFLIEMPQVIERLHERPTYHWAWHVTLLSFWRMMLQGVTGGPLLPIVKLLWLASVFVLGATLALTARHARRSDDPRAVGRWLAAAICAMPLLMPYFMDYDLLLLAVPAVLLAGDLQGSNATARVDRRLSWLWLATAMWLVVQPPSATAWPINVTAAMLLLVTAQMIRRVAPRRSNAQVDATTTTTTTTADVTTAVRVAA